MSHTTKIKLGGIEYLAIDLTQPLRLDTEVYPGNQKPQRKISNEVYEISKSLSYIHELDDHVFQPHADAPKHQNPDLKEKGIESFGIEYCFNRACLIDLSDSKESEEIGGIKYLVDVKKEHLEPFAESLSQVEAALIRTGYDGWLEKNKPHNRQYAPYLSGDAAEFIASFDKIKVVGVDSLTVDSDESHVSHKALALKNIMIVESLVHLYEIPLENRLGFDLQTTPIRIVGATGGPVAAYAYIKL